jgi:hypothetical protein
MRTTLTILVFFTCSVTKAQSVSTLMGARAQGLGYATSVLTDSWGVFNNIAGIAALTHPTASFTYDLRNALPGADRTAAAIVWPIKAGVLGGGVFTFGDALYSESIITAGFSNQLGLASLGLNVNYIQYRAEGFGTKGVFTVNFGGIAELTPTLSVGANITNINQPKLSTDDDRLPTILTAGLAFKPTDNVFIATEIEKNIDYKTTWRMGLEYLFHKKFCARTGYAIQPNTAYFGMGFKTTRFNIDYAIQYSTQLQFGHQASVTYHFNQ